MILYLLRHGVAEDAGPATGFRDEPRALTDDGVARMRRAARGMLGLGIAPELVLSSPLTRCRQTAEIVADVLGVPMEEDAQLAPGMELDDLRQAIGERGSPDIVLACGHQPDLSVVASDLIGGGAVEFRKGSLAVIEIEAVRSARGHLRALYPPATLRQLGR